MLATPSDFLLLAATLVDALPASSPVSDTLLMQLHAVFGPMLLSALQLIDRREVAARRCSRWHECDAMKAHDPVVLVDLPGGRTLYQVTSSSGDPYTLYNSLPEILPPVPGRAATGVDEDRPPSPTPAAIPDLTGPSTPPPLEPERDHRADLDTGAEAYLRELREHEISRVKRVRQLAQIMERMYCPCAGFLYNSLGGDKNYLCKHLLAVLIAHHTTKAVKTEVYLPGVVELLGLAKRVEDQVEVVA